MLTSSWPEPQKEFLAFLPEAERMKWIMALKKYQSKGGHLNKKNNAILRSFNQRYQESDFYKRIQAKCRHFRRLTDPEINEPSGLLAETPPEEKETWCNWDEGWPYDWRYEKSTRDGY